MTWPSFWQFIGLAACIAVSTPTFAILTVAFLWRPRADAPGGEG